MRNMFVSGGFPCGIFSFLVTSMRTADDSERGLQVGLLICNGGAGVKRKNATDKRLSVAFFADG